MRSAYTTMLKSFPPFLACSHPELSQIYASYGLMGVGPGPQYKGLEFPSQNEALGTVYCTIHQWHYKLNSYIDPANTALRKLPSILNKQYFTVNPLRQWSSLLSPDSKTSLLLLFCWLLLKEPNPIQHSSSVVAMPMRYAVHLVVRVQIWRPPQGKGKFTSGLLCSCRKMLQKVVKRCSLSTRKNG